MNKFYFCTYFDWNYSDKGLALYESLERHIQSFTIFILCLDDMTYSALCGLYLPSAVLIPLNKLESRDLAFFKTKKTRSLIEYYFTLTPVLLLDILKNFMDIDILTYLDADLYFFGSPEAAYEEMGNNSILIIEHRFPEILQNREKYGIYNVGFLSFRNDENGAECIKWWREKCIDWCFDRLEDERFADQKYLDKWPQLFPKVKILKHKGVNVAPWNVINYKFHLGPSREYYVDEKPLLIYHFHGLKKLFQYNNIQIFDMNLCNYKIKNINVVDGFSILKSMHHDYLSHLDKCYKKIENSYNIPFSKKILLRNQGLKGDSKVSQVLNFFRMSGGTLIYYTKKLRCRDIIFLDKKK